MIISEPLLATFKSKGQFLRQLGSSENWLKAKNKLILSKYSTHTVVNNTKATVLFYQHLNRNFTAYFKG